MGLVPPPAGISFDDQDITRAPSWKRVAAGIGFVPQGREIFRASPSRRTCSWAWPPGRAVSSRASSNCSRCWEMMGRRGGDLSGGQQQQLAIGRALAFGPRALIPRRADRGHPASIIKDIERAIRSLAETGEMAILLVEQYYDFARALADQYLVMERGEIIMRGAGADMDRDGCAKALALMNQVAASRGAAGPAGLHGRVAAAAPRWCAHRRTHQDGHRRSPPPCAAPPSHPPCRGAAIGR